MRPTLLYVRRAGHLIYELFSFAPIRLLDEADEVDF
jgi:hypothetical protein